MAMAVEQTMRMCKVSSGRGLEPRHPVWDQTWGGRPM